MGKLGDAFILIRNGANIKQGMDDTGYPITRIETIANRSVDRSKMGYAGITEINKYSDYVLKNGDILMSHINSVSHLGKSAIYKSQGDEIIIHGMNLLCLRSNPKKTFSDYAYYYFNSNAFHRQILPITKKSVNQASFTVTALKEIDIPLPSLEEQQKIAATLDKVTDLINLRKKELEKLDLLVKSRFVEMFDDLKHECAISEVCSIITDGTHQPPKFTKNGIPFLFVSNIVTNEISYNTEKYISEETYNELYKRTPIEIGDIVLSTVGSYGHPAIVKKEKRFLFQRHIAYLKPITSIVNSTYLHSAILSRNVQEQIEDRVKGIAQKTLNLSEIRKITIPLPPIDLQNQFADFVTKNDKSKYAVKKSLEKLETLKKSLMQEYFG